jgi:hypothetical protein
LLTEHYSGEGISCGADLALEPDLCASPTSRPGARGSHIVSRFTKAAAVEQLQALAAARQDTDKFDLGNGTAQLWPRGADERTKALIDRAVSYGYFMSLRSVAQDIESGHLGVSTK